MRPREYRTRFSRCGLRHGSRQDKIACEAAYLGYYGIDFYTHLQGKTLPYPADTEGYGPRFNFDYVREVTPGRFVMIKHDRTKKDGTILQSVVLVPGSGLFKVLEGQMPDGANAPAVYHSVEADL
jgi:hypothetical protein